MTDSWATTPDSSQVADDVEESTKKNANGGTPMGCAPGAKEGPKDDAKEPDLTVTPIDSPQVDDSQATLNLKGAATDTKDDAPVCPAAWAVRCNLYSSRPVMQVAAKDVLVEFLSSHGACLHTEKFRELYDQHPWLKATIGPLREFANATDWLEYIPHEFDTPVLVLRECYRKAEHKEEHVAAGVASSAEDGWKPATRSRRYLRRAARAEGAGRVH